MADAGLPGDTRTMDNKKWLFEVEFLACAVAMATVAFTLMVGNALWKRMAGD
jgi:hypothetical protein